jgi:hypothetical protein
MPEKIPPRDMDVVQNKRPEMGQLKERVVVYGNQYKHGCHFGGQQSK